MKKLVSPSLNSSASEIIFIDAGVNNYQLIPSNTETEIVILDSNRNGVEQITQSLSNSNNLDSIHIISQGREGAIALGTTELNLNSLQSYQNSLQSWSNALNSDADILLYGCNVAAGTTGTAFIDRLSQLTTADIAASNDITGREDLNGDWELEIATGQIEAQIAIAAKNQGLYGSVLATYNGSQYQLTSESLSWSEAQAEAKSFGGNLVVINDAAEQKWLNQTFGNTQQFWIGLSDAEQEGNFQWVDGSDRNYQNWAEGEPNDSKFDGAYPQGEDYVLMNWNSLGQWNDLSNSYGGTFRGIIEIDNNTSLSGLEPIVDYENFTSLDSLTLNGNAVGYNNRLRLTPSAKIQRGSAFFNRPLAIDGATSFSTQFEFELSGGTTGADGFTFMLQNDPRGVNALGGLGGSLGYSGLTQSLAIEFDSHFNSRYDSNNNHISVLRDGDVKNSLATTDSPFDLNGGGVLNAWVDYDGKRNLLEVYLAQNKSKPDTPLTALDLDLSDVVGERAFVGFSAATGGRTNNHDLLAWQFTTNADLSSFNAGVLGLETSSYQVSELDNTVEVSVLRTGGTDGRASIDYATVDATAIAGEDYLARSGTLVFESGESKKTISIPILDDNLAESTEEFGLAIDNIVGDATLLVPRTALITIVDNEAGLEPIVDYENFTSLDSLTLNGNAVGYNNRLRLTPSAKIQRGSAFFNRPLAIDGATSFSTQFEFELSGGTTGADGFTFMLQNDPRGVNALGGLGGSLGYSGLTQSLAIEFDSHFNSRYDSNNNHISVLRDGDVKNSLATTDSPFDLNGGGVLNAWVDYDGKRNLLEVYLAQNKSKPDTPLTALDLDLSDVVGERAFVGFSAATGGRTNNHDLLAWQFTTNADLLPPPASAVNLNNEIVVSDLLQPTAVEWTPDGDTMLIAQKRGVISVFKDGALLSTPFIDLSDRVNGTRDRGLLDIAVHPDFYNGSPYVYALYTYDPPEVYQNTGLARPDGKGNRAGRLTRITADASTNFTTAVPGSEVVILGTNSTWENFNGFTNSTNDIQEPPAGILPDGTNLRDFLAADSESHTIGSVEFGPDGALYVSNGDGASYNRVDPRAIRVQDIDNLSGKILRIDPITGEGLTDNPFYNGDKNANRSKVYQYGLRNPFRISIDPLDGRVYVGDVGWTTWEEINASNPGANFGWPYYEGADTFNRKTREYRDLPEAKAFYQSGESVTTAFLGLNHRSFGISAVVVGDVYRGNAFPEQYQGDLFFNDLGGGIVRNVSLDEAGNITSIDTFTTGAMVVVQISQAPDGSLYYVDLDDGLVGRWFFN